ncbi:MAG: hypothetical protein M0Z48_07985 [Nitrospiraceae bacterium]|nr:hypothetical protein [Nitrospiraceae bacterium]
MKRRISRFVTFGVLIVSAVFALSACGMGPSSIAGSSNNSGGNTSNPNSSGGSSGSVTSDLIYMSGAIALGSNAVSTTGGVYADDPSNPSSPTQVDSGVLISSSSSGPVLGGIYNSTAGQVSNMNIQGLVYIKGGKIFNVTGALTPVQISTETEACRLQTKGDGILYDWANLNNSIIPYIQAGPDGQCGDSDDITKVIRLGMSASDLPIQAETGAMHAINNILTGALESIIVYTGNEFDACTPYFTSCNKLQIPSTGWPDYPVRQFADSDRAAILSGSADNKFAYIYDADSGTVSGPFEDGGLSDTVSSSIQNDKSDVYFICYGDSVCKLSSNGTFSTLYTENSTEPILAGLTDNYILYYADAFDGSSYVLKSVSKAGGSPINLASDSSSWPSVSDGVEGTNGDHVYYNLGSGTIAGIANADGTGKKEIQNASWVGSSDSNSSMNMWQMLNWGSKEFHNQNVYTIFLQDSSRNISAYDASTGNMLQIMGTLPSDLATRTTNCGGFGSNIFGFGENTWLLAINSNCYTDILYMNTGVANSLVRVTNTPSISEW